jgi:hypothetical protein
MDYEAAIFQTHSMKASLPKADMLNDWESQNIYHKILAGAAKIHTS